MTEPREITKAEYEATFSPPMLDVTEGAEEIVDLWAYVDPVIEEKYHSCTAWEWEVKFIYESRDGSYQHINIPVPKDDTYLVVIVDKPNGKIIGHYILDLRSVAYEQLAKQQNELCADFKCECVPPDPASKLGFALDTKHRLPLNGLRHPPEGDTNGWYLWGGEDFPSDDDSFAPLHTLHLVDYGAEMIKFLGLPPGYRFLIAGDYVDVWFDPSLLN